MIRRGKQEGWLRAEPSALQAWMAFHGVEIKGVEIQPVEGKGLAVLAKSNVESPLMRIPRDLVLSKETVELYAKSDYYLRTILDLLGDFGRTSRGSILVFLLYQSTKYCPNIGPSTGGPSPLAEYIKFLPLELLPTFWSEKELELLIGTSLEPAIKAKLKSLNREFDLLRSSTAAIAWCQDNWWDPIDGVITFDDWKQVDAFFRSRALEFPGIGDCMVPCIDMCNHASGARTRALYESDSQGNAILLARDECAPESSDEITITYGDEKGACEMVFSYGFLESGMDSAKTIFLGLDIPDSDPLKAGKLAITTTAPGVRLTEDQSGNLRWFSDYVWLVIVNQEDGLNFEITQTREGENEIQATWQKSELSNMSVIEESLRRSPAWNIYELRAIVILQGRVEDQLRALYRNEAGFQLLWRDTDLRHQPRMIAQRLRALENELLEKFYEHLEEAVGASPGAIVESVARQRLILSMTVTQKLRLAASSEVQEYLSQAALQEEDDDFS